MDNSDFLTIFFGPGNRLEWGHFPADWAEWLKPQILRLENKRFPIFLPRYTPQNRMAWYAVVSSPLAVPELAEMITAFLAPSYAEFSGRLATLDSDDPIDAAVHSVFGDWVFRFVVPNRADVSFAREAIDAIVYLVDSRPAEVRRFPRPTGRVLRDFELALLAGDDGLARDQINELRLNGHLTTANLSFLEVVRRAAFADWEGLLNYPDVPRLIEMRRPQRVTNALVEAVYRRQFLGIDQPEDVSLAIARMRDEVLPRFGPLYGSIAPQGVFAIRSLLLVSLALDVVKPSDSRELLAAAETSDDPYANLLATRLLERLDKAEAVPTTTMADAQDALARGQAQVAFGLLVDLPVSTERAILLCECAYELNKLDAALTAADALASLPEAARRALPQTRHFQEVIAHVEAWTGPNADRFQVPTTWVQWFETIAKEPRSRPLALTWADIGAEEWPAEEWTDPDCLRRIAAALGSGEDDVVELQSEALCHLLRSLARVPRSPIHRVLRLRVLDTLLYRGRHTQAELETLLDVLEEVLGDVDTAEYERILKDLADLWSIVQSPAYFEWVIQALDLLAFLPCRSNKARDQIAFAMFATVRAHERRVDPALAETLNDLARELGLPREILMPEAAAEAGVQDPLKSLAGKHVAIYTLTESAGARAKEFLLKAAHARVEILSDKVATEALRVAAREADIFVMVTRSAKHAATDCIRANRVVGFPLVTTTGKGSSSILYALRRHLERSAESAA